MGSLRKQRKREASKKEFTRKQSQTQRQQGGRFISASRRQSQIDNDPALAQAIADQRNVDVSEVLSPERRKELEQSLVVQQQNQTEQRQQQEINKQLKRQQQEEENRQLRERLGLSEPEDVTGFRQISRDLESSGFEAPLSNSGTPEVKLQSQSSSIPPPPREDFEVTLPTQSSSVPPPPVPKSKVSPILQRFQKQSSSIPPPPVPQQTIKPPTQSSNVPPPKVVQQGSVGFIPPSPDAPGGFLVEVPPNVPPKPQQGPVPTSAPIDEFIKGFTDPFVNLGKVFVAAPEAVRRDVTQGFGSGEKFFQEEVAPDLRPTPLSTLLQGDIPDPKDPRTAGSIFGEGLLIAAPVGVLKGARGTKGATTPKTPKPPTTPKTGEIRLTPTNMFRKQLPPNDELFAADTASPFSSTRVNLGAGAGGKPPGFETTVIPLGRGSGIVVPKDGGVASSSVPKTGPGTTKGGGTFTQKKFDEPTVRPIDKILDTGFGTQQIQKTKLTKKVKQQTKQKQDVIEKLANPKQTQKPSSSLDNLFSRPKKLKQKKKVPPVAVVLEDIFIQKPRTTQIQGGRFVQQPRVNQTPGVTFKQTPKQKQKPKQAFPPLVLTKQTPKQTPKQEPAVAFTPLQTPRLAQPVPEKPLFPLFGPPIQLPPLGRAGGSPRRKPTKQAKAFVVSSLDPQTPGTIARAGVRQQQKSRRADIFGKIDIQLGKARNRKGKKNSKSVLDDPFGKITF